MTDIEKNEFEDDGFWNLDQYAKNSPVRTQLRQFPKSATNSVSIESDVTVTSAAPKYSDSAISKKRDGSPDSTITRYIPPHSDAIFAKKHILYNYSPSNPLIKEVRICSNKEDDQIFPQSNLFLRERRAILNRKAVEAPYAAYYSYSPRYSQMSRAQLSYYLWWRENTRNGIFLKTDESYIILYAYELVTVGEGEDKQAALDMLCSLLTNYKDKDINVVFRMMIRDLICDFCLVHGLSVPLNKLSGVGRLILANCFLPEFFVDLSEENRSGAMDIGLSGISLYDYKKSKIYTPENADKFKSAMNGALSAIINREESFKAITAFTNGVYGVVTVEHKPFTRMINIVNKSIKLEISYYQMSGIQSAVTDAMRYSENRLREHLGVKNKLHITAINPSVKLALDDFFDSSFPAMPTVDRRRKAARLVEEEVHEYDRFYDVPKAEISPEHALEIERDSWSTTKILTEAFADEKELAIEESNTLNAPELIIEPIPTPAVIEEVSPSDTSTNTQSTLYMQIRDELGELADFIEVCKKKSATDQRAFAASYSLSVDEIADRINEGAVNVFGDIVLEDNGGFYAIIEDYIDQF